MNIYRMCEKYNSDAQVQTALIPYYVLNTVKEDTNEKDIKQYSHVVI